MQALRYQNTAPCLLTLNLLKEQNILKQCCTTYDADAIQ